MKKRTWEALRDPTVMSRKGEARWTAVGFIGACVIVWAQPVWSWLFG